MEHQQGIRMTKIWKYDIPLTTNLVIEIPSNSKILTALLQYEQIRLWVQVEPESPKRKRKFHVMGTNHDFEKQAVDPHNLIYINTVMQGPFVWHVYEEVLPSSVFYKEKS